MPDGLADEAQRRGLQTARHTRFPSVVINDDDESQLVAVKAVTTGYPLRGQLRLAKLDKPLDDAPLAEPRVGSVWVDVQLKNILSLEQGDTLALGASDFSVDRIVTYEPDRGQNVFEIAPRGMMNEADLASAELLGAGSRARFTLLMAGERGDVAGMRDWLADNHAQEVRVQSVEDGSPQMERALGRAKQFLGLASVVTVLLAGAAIALAVRHFALRQADASAVLRTLGASRRDVVVWLVWRLLLIALLASLVGIVIGWFAQLILASLLAGWFKLTLPAPGLMPPIIGALTALVALAGFGILPVWRAGRVAVMAVLQRDYAGLDVRVSLSAVLGIFATYFVVLLLSGDFLLSIIVVLGVVAMLLVFALFGQVIIGVVRKLASGRYRFYPMVRARLVAHNGEPVALQNDSERANRRARREYNVSYSATLPPANELIEGEWWDSDGSAPPSLSLEEEWARANNYAVGDTLTFKSAGIETTGTIANLRKVDWESFQVNFFVVASESMLTDLPATHVTSFHIEDDFVASTASLAREFPGIATLDIGAIIKRVKTLMERASLAVEYVFLFTLLAGVCVLLAAVQSSQRERIRESALLRVLGASHGQVRQSVLAEFAILGAIAGLLAAVFASTIAWALSRFVFELPYEPNLWLWLLGVLGGSVGISVAGYLATRRVLHTPPVVALRHTG